MKNKTALITDHTWPSVDIEKNLLEKAGFNVLIAPDQDAETLMVLAQNADAILFCFAQVTTEILLAAKCCLVAARYGIGLDNIDLQTATQKGIVVTNVPDYCQEEVSDHVLGMALALNRRMLVYDTAIKQGNWTKIKINAPVKRMARATFGIVGLGRIGQAVARKVQGFGARTLAYSPSREIGTMLNDTKFCSLSQVLAESDFISINAPFTATTRNMIGYKEIAAMKPGVILLITSRGGIVDEDALADALDSGHVGGAGLDVWQQEPPPDEHRLFSSSNVIFTPHTAFYSMESISELEHRVAQEVIRVTSGKHPANLANPDVLGHSRVGI